MSESKNRKIGAVLSYVSIIVSTMVELLYTPFLVSKLGQGEYGLYSLVTSVIGYLTVLDLGFGNAIVVYTSKYIEKKEYEKIEVLHGMFKCIYFIIGLISAIAGLIVYFNIDNLFGKTMSFDELLEMKIMMPILIFNLVISFMFSIYSSIINANEKFIFQKIVSILNTILKPLIMIPLLFMGYKSVAMCVVVTIVNIIVLLSNYYYCKYKIKEKVSYHGFDKKLFKVIFGYSFWLFLGTIVDKVNWSVDQIILGTFSGTIAISIYAIASQFNQMFINLSTAISGVLLPKISKMVAKGSNSEELTNEFIKVGRIQYYIIFLMCTGFIVLGKQFILSWVGEEYSDSYYTALWLIIPVCIPLIQNLGLSIMQAMNKYKFKSISSFIMTIFNIILSIILVKKYGAIGAAAGTGITLIICNIILINIYYYKVIGLDVLKFWNSIIHMTIFLILPLCILLIFKNIIVINGIKGFIMYGIVYVLEYSIFAYIFVANNYEKNTLNKLLSKFKIKEGAK
jgi:O-antigen/teichoic acid export membrane protein